jgi:hypothetical protein
LRQGEYRNVFERFSFKGKQRNGAVQEEPRESRQGFPQRVEGKLNDIGENRGNYSINVLVHKWD